MKYKIIFDAGKPFELLADSDEALEYELRRFYKENKNSDYPYDVTIFNEQGDNISETQFIEEMIGEIIK